MTKTPAAFDLQSAADTTVTAVLTDTAADLLLAAGDRIGLKYSASTAGLVCWSSKCTGFNGSRFMWWWLKIKARAGLVLYFSKARSFPARLLPSSEPDSDLLPLD
jgi:hypothetical protein